MTERGAGPLVAVAAAALLAAWAAVFALGVAHGETSVDAYERAALALAAIPVAVVAVLVRPAYLFSAGLALAIFNSHWGDLHLGIALDRVALAGAVVSVLWRERRSGLLTTRPIDWLLMVVALYAFVSAVVGGTLDIPDAKFALIDRLGLLPFLLFFAAPLAFRDARDRQVLLVTLVAMGAYLGLIAFFETVGPKALILPHYINDPDVGIHYGRARGPFTESVADGISMFACAVAASMAMVVWRERRARTIAGAVALLCALGILFTVTRGAWLCAIGGASVALLFARETRRVFLPVAGLGVLTVIVAFAVVPGLQARADRRTNDQQPIYDRRNSNDAALRMIDARPAFGFGWGHFELDSQDYFRQAPDYPLTLKVRNVHNVYLANAVELGLIGTGLWLLALALAFGRGIFQRGPPALRPWRIGLLAITVSYLIVAMTTPLGYALPTLLLWTWAGVCWADIRGTAR